MFTTIPWHALSKDEALQRLGTDPCAGLDRAEAQQRLEAHGPNCLPEAPRTPAWKSFLGQFANVLTLVLIAAAVLAGVIGDTTDMVVILVVVTFNAVLGHWQEHRAERILEALKAMLAHQSRVRRQGCEEKLGSDQLVPGDIVLLEAGDRVPADGRLVEAHQLEIDESSLTGESLAVRKTVQPVAADAALADRSCMALMNTVVTRGRGVMLVTGTGAGTEMGRVADMLQEVAEGQTPLQRKLDHLGKRLALIAGIVVMIILGMGLARGEPLAEVILTSIALAVAAIPEGLPAVVTVTLAVGMYQMTRRGAIVKRLSAVETLGCTTVICSDKTGTLTVNQMTARSLVVGDHAIAVSGEGYGAEGALTPEAAQPLPDLTLMLRAAVLCNDSRIEDGRLIGDATEGALLALAAKAGLAVEDERRLERLSELPFESERKFMATAHAAAGGGVELFVKGAPDVLLARCSGWMAADGIAHPLDAAARERLQTHLGHLADQALRVLALAVRRLPALEAGAIEEAVQELTLLGLVGLMDPPRREAADAIAACHQAGIAVKMITGDHRLTAAAVARELALPGDVLTGHDLDLASDLAGQIDQVGVFARVAPEHKVRIVKALKQRGHVVAMTGDGVNDAAALRASDIGVAMGRTGTDVTREAATMVLTDDNFATIVRAVKEGRTIYDNIVKFVRFQLSTNVGALLTVFTAPLLALPVPFNPIQILWVNIIMDGPPAMALAFDPSRKGVMTDPPRPPDEPILTPRRMLRLALYGLTMMVGTLLVLQHALQTGDETYARTLAFTTFVLFQFFNVFNARVGAESAFNRNMLANGKLWLALLGVLGLQALAVHWGPAQAVFHTSALSAQDWALAASVASSILILDESRKLLWRLARVMRG